MHRLGSRLRHASLMCFALSIAFSLHAHAGEIGDSFIPVLQQAGPDEFVSGIVMLSEQLDLDWIENEIAAREYTSRWRRHGFVIRRAQSLAARTQGDLLVALEGYKRQGKVANYKPYWIANLVVVDATPSVFYDLTLRADVGLIHFNAPIDLRIAETALDEPLPATETYYPGQFCINVGPAWDLGYTGSGTLVCSFDSGADGSHEALADTWRGAETGVEWWEAWRDPYGGTEFPYDTQNHGTHVLGIMCATPPGGDPIGIAYDTKWIAAWIGYNVGEIIGCYQWAADPDSNSTTIDDVPDVVNNSWGTTLDCDDTYWAAIDVIEAAGIVNTIAVDNRGPDSMTVNSPESRIDTPYKNFGVGNVDPNQLGYPIRPNSGRGPSPCDSVTIKPEVTAPGTSIYSTLPGDDYGSKTGTSMACPHASGAVAILRQVNPDLGVAEIKQYLMDTAHDKGAPGEDHPYGWGIIDVGAAVAAVLAETSPLPYPINLSGMFDAPNEVELSWELPAGGSGSWGSILKFNIYRTTPGTPFPEFPIDTTAADTLAYSDIDLGAGLYDYVVTAVYAGGESSPSNLVTVEIPDPLGVTAVERAATSALLTSAPNPFQPFTTLRYHLAEGYPARITIHDAGGRTVRELDVQGGNGEVVWDGRDSAERKLASGVYFARLRQNGVSVSQRLILIR